MPAGTWGTAPGREPCPTYLPDCSPYRWCAGPSSVALRTSLVLVAVSGTVTLRPAPTVVTRSSAVDVTSGRSGSNRTHTSQVRPGARARGVQRSRSTVNGLRRSWSRTSTERIRTGSVPVLVTVTFCTWPCVPTGCAVNTGVSTEMRRPACAAGTTSMVSDVVTGASDASPS